MGLHNAEIGLHNAEIGLHNAEGGAHGIAQLGGCHGNTQLAGGSLRDCTQLVGSLLVRTHTVYNLKIFPTLPTVFAYGTMYCSTFGLEPSSSSFLGQR